MYNNYLENCTIINAILRNDFFDCENYDDLDDTMKDYLSRLCDYIDRSDRATIRNYENGYFEIDNTTLGGCLTFGLVARANMIALEDNPKLKNIVNCLYPNGCYGGGVWIYYDLLDRDNIIALVDTLDTLTDYPLIDDEIYSRLEDDVLYESVNDFITYHPDYENRKEDIVTFAYEQGHVEEDYYYFDEKKLIEYLAI